MSNQKIIPADAAAIIENCPYGVVTVNSSSLVDYANVTFTQITGIAAEEIINLSNHAMWQTLLKYFAVDGNMKSYIGGMLTLRARQHKKVIRLSCQLPQQSRTKQILYFQDITSESEVDTMKSEFLYAATHELRNPIAIIFGFSELLLGTELAREQSIEVLETIHQQAKELNHLTNELLDIARIESRKGKDFSLAVESIATILQMVQKEWAARAGSDRIKLNLPEKIPHVWIDKDKIKQAITNIISNACKYSNEDRAVQISVVLDKAVSDSLIGIAIRDEGFGMSADEKQHLFERFWRADRLRNLPGTGLGMAIVKEIVEYHQGSIQIDSAVNQGTTVTVWLPIYIDMTV